MDITKVLADFIAELTYEKLPDSVIQQTKLYIADYLASSVAGEKINSKFNTGMWAIVSESAGKEEASVLHQKQLLPVEQAGFMNGIYAHGADMDDGNRKAMGHVAASVMSAVFAFAETMEKVSWNQVIVAINAGYEVYNRVAASAQPGLVHRGFHSTGTAGIIACAAACAKLMKLDAIGIFNAMSIAAIQASGLIIIAESGQSCKPLNPANAARGGIISAKLAKAGIEGPVNPLESKKGWLHAMTDVANLEMLTENLGKTFTICESYLKPYPSCRHTHCGIEAVCEIRNQIIKENGNFSFEDIEEVNVYTYRNAIQIAGQIQIPATADDAKFSIHYSLAVALLNGYFGLDDLVVPGSESDVCKLISKIKLIEDETMENVKEGIRGAKVLVKLKNGKEYSNTVTIPKGDAANPMTWEDMEAKMKACFKGICDTEESIAVIEKIKSISPEMPYTPACRFVPAKK